MSGEEKDFTSGKKIGTPYKEDRITNLPEEEKEKYVKDVCEIYANGTTLTKACEVAGITKDRFWRLIGQNESYYHLFREAREKNAEALVEQMIEIADDGRNDFMEQFDKDGEHRGYFINGEHSKRSELRIKTRQWIASKHKAKLYGDSSLVKLADNEGDKLNLPQIYFGTYKKPEDEVKSETGESS